MSKPAPYSFRFEPALRADYERWAQEEGRTLANYIERVLKLHAEQKAEAERKAKRK